MSAPAEGAAGQSTSWLDLSSIAICTAAWGTTWYAITLQFGVVDPIVSVAYRFAIAGAVIFAWCKLRGERIALTRAQHLFAAGVGVVTFGINYPFVYLAEQWVTSAVVAVVFASMAFLNLAGFRIAFGQRAPLQAWGAAGLGMLGVALLSWGEVIDAHLDANAMLGLGLTFTGVIAAVIGNIFARNGEGVQTPLIASTGWAMLYGAAALALFCAASGRAFAFDMSARYVGSLLYLAIVGSVIAFLVYYALARRRGYATASYISALAPPVAMMVSSVFEAKTWGALAFVGVALVLAGQWLLLRVKRS